MRFYNINGEEFPSVTTILSALPQPTALKLFIENNINAKFIAAERAYIGVMSHFYFESQNAIKLDQHPILEEVDEQFNTEENKEIITNIKTKIDFFLMDYDLKPVYLEEKLWSHKYKTAGRCDYIGYLNGILSIVDLKTSKAFYASDTGFDSHSIQLSAYKYCAKETLGLEIEKLYILRTHEDSWYELREKEYNIDGFEYARKLFWNKHGK